MTRWLLLALLSLTGTSCVQRHLDITSDPSGAFVFLDGRLAGKTPLRVDFDHYGYREIILRHPGFDLDDPRAAQPRAATGSQAEDRRTVEFRTVNEIVEIETPWFQYFPIDLVTEHFWPVPLEDRHAFHYRLERYDPAESMSQFEADARDMGFYDTDSSDLPELPSDEKR